MASGSPLVLRKSHSQRWKASRVVLVILAGRVGDGFVEILALPVFAGVERGAVTVEEQRGQGVNRQGNGGVENRFAQKDISMRKKAAFCIHLMR